MTPTCQMSVEYRRTSADDALAECAEEGGLGRLVGVVLVLDFAFLLLQLLLLRPKLRRLLQTLDERERRRREGDARRRGDARHIRLGIGARRTSRARMRPATRSAAGSNQHAEREDSQSDRARLDRGRSCAESRVTHHASLTVRVASSQWRESWQSSAQSRLLHTPSRPTGMPNQPRTGKTEYLRVGFYPCHVAGLSRSGPASLRACRRRTTNTQQTLVGNPKHSQTFERAPERKQMECESGKDVTRLVILLRCIAFLLLPSCALLCPPFPFLREFEFAAAAQ